MLDETNCLQIIVHICMVFDCNFVDIVDYIKEEACDEKI